MFFGALLSAILSTASARCSRRPRSSPRTCCAAFVPNMGDRQLLLTVRLVLVIFTCRA
jgi:solute:Na+ symporter, SSS family